jgi:hypothetical protein
MEGRQLSEDDLILELKKNLAAFPRGVPWHGFRPVRVRTIKAMIERLENIGKYECSKNET